MAAKGRKKPASKPLPMNALSKNNNTAEEYNMLYDVERFRILFEESLDAVYIINRQGIIMDLNSAGCELLGYSPDEIIGKNVETTYARNEDRARLLKALGSSDRIRDFEVALKRKDGTQIICMVTSIVRRSRTGDILGYQGILRDISKSKHLELSLKAEYERAEFYNDLMSHDINNFNQGAMSNLELLLLSGELSGKSERYVKNAFDQITGSANLISNLRKLQAIKSGEVVAQTVDVIELLEDAILSSRALFPGKDIEIKVARETKDATIVGSRLLLEAFINLITNAIKFNRAKDIQIVICVSSHESGFLKLEFMDNGPGVEDSMKEKIFDRSLRLHPEIWGTGLGLTLAKTIVESFGGCIYVENRVKNDHTHGSNFVVILRRGS